MTTPQKTRELLSLAISLLIVFVIGLLSLIAWTQLRRAGGQLEISRRVLRASSSLLSTVKDAETGQRGFLLTGQDSYLEPYRQAVSRISPLSKELKDVTVPRPDQTTRVEALLPLVDQKMAELQRTVELRQSGHLEAALALVNSDQGKVLMDSIRQRSAEIQVAADGRISDYGRQVHAWTLLLEWVGTVGGIALMGLLIMATRTIRRSNKDCQTLIDKITTDRDSLHTMLRSIGDAVIVTDVEGRVALLNGVAESLTGWTDADAQGAPLDQIFVATNEQTGASVESPVTKAIREGRIVGLANHTVLTSRDGKSVPIEDSAAPIRDVNHKVSGVILVFRDVTQARTAEDQLRAAVDCIDQLAWIANADGWLYWYNKRWYEYTGTTAQQMEGWGWKSVHDPEMLPQVLEKWTDSIRTGAPFDMVFPLKGADGKFKTFLTRVNPVRDQDGTVVRWFGTNTDIDELERTQAIIRASEEHFRQLAESMPHAVWTATPDGVCDYINMRWTDLTGCDLAATQGEVFLSRMLPEDAQAIVQAKGEGLLAGTQYSVECRFRRPDGALEWNLMRAVPVRRSDGKIVRWFGTATDINDQKRTEDELRRANYDLQSFAYSASHDLQEPIRNVSVYSELIARQYHDSLDAEGKQFLAFLADGGRRLARLVNDLLLYTTSGNVEDSFTNVDASETLRQTLLDLSVAIRENDAIITFDPLPTLEMSEAHLQQLFQNLINNALKYRTNEPPRLHIAAHVAEGSGGFSVKDNGIGIDPAYKETIFGVFKRLNQDSKYEGTGIGLAICQRLVQRYGGRIWVESELGKGATFFVSIPQKTSSTADGPPAALAKTTGK